MADALLLSLTVLTLFDVVFVSGASILTSQATYVRRHEQGSGRIAIAGLARSAALWTWLGMIFGIVCGVGGRPLAMLIAPGFSTEARIAFANCTLLAALLPVASSLIAFASALNRVNGREVLFTVNPLVINGVSWLAISIASATGGSQLQIVRAFLLTVVTTTLMMFGWQLACMDRALRSRLIAHFVRSLRPQRFVRRARAHFRELRLIAPIVGALLIQQVVTLISYAFVTRAGSGFLLLYGLAERLTNVIFAVFVMTFLTVLEPRWIRATVRPQASREVQSDVAVLCAGLLSLTATLMFAGDSLAIILFGHGAVSARDIKELGEIARIYALTLPGLSLGVVLARLLVIHNRGGQIFVVNVFVTALHLALCYGSFKLWGARGVAGALVLTLAVQAVLYGWLFAKAQRLRSDGILLLGARLLAVGLLVVLAAWATAQTGLTPLIRVMTVGLASLLATFVGAWLVRLRLLETLQRLARI
jgi:peptidoglycan biosynthesis protein MviN/MurJ (putative lipid II flippase)